MEDKWRWGWGSWWAALRSGERGNCFFNVSYERRIYSQFLKKSYTQKGVGGAVETAQPVKCLPHKHEELRSIPNTHVKSQAWWQIHILVWRQWAWEISGVCKPTIYPRQWRTVSQKPSHSNIPDDDTQGWPPPSACHTSSHSHRKREGRGATEGTKKNEKKEINVFH